MAIYRRTFVLFLTVTLATFGTAATEVSVPPADSTEARIIKFDVAGAGTAAGQGTIPIGIVQGGWVMGTYVDSNNVSHGFLRTPRGVIIKFDAPGAGTNPSQGTIEVHGMNRALEIVGTYQDTNNSYHGFRRSAWGSFTTFDCPGAGTSGFQGTAVHAVNDAGLISAEYADANYDWHGCVITPDGNASPYDPPNIGTVPDSGQGTFPAIFSGITPEGAIIGEFLDGNYVFHGYLRAPDGTITQIDNTNGGSSAFQGTATTGISPKGEIHGSYVDVNNVSHGYLRARDGAVTQVDIPGSGTGPFQGTDSAPFIPFFGGINPAGTITGFYADQNNTYHGYLRTAHGKVVTFDVSGATTGNFQGTLPLNINPEGEVTGWFVDPNGVNHGFVRTPEPHEDNE